MLEPAPKALGIWLNPVILLFQVLHLLHIILDQIILGGVLIYKPEIRLLLLCLLPFLLLQVRLERVLLRQLYLLFQP